MEGLRLFAISYPTRFAIREPVTVAIGQGLTGDNVAVALGANAPRR